VSLSTAEHKIYEQSELDAASGFSCLCIFGVAKDKDRLNKQNAKEPNRNRNFRKTAFIDTDIIHLFWFI